MMQEQQLECEYSKTAHDKTLMQPGYSDMTRATMLRMKRLEEREGKIKSLDLWGIGYKVPQK